MNEHLNLPARSFGRGLLRNPGLDEMFEGLLRPLANGTPIEARMPALDIYEAEANFTIRAELPGVDVNQIDVTVHEGVLTITAETKSEDSDENGRPLRRERWVGKFKRTLRLGADAEETGVKAAYKDGVLEILVPKAEVAKPHRVAVEVS